MEHLILQVFKWECVLTIEGAEYRTNAVQDESVITCLKSMVSTCQIYPKYGSADFSATGSENVPKVML